MLLIGLERRSVAAEEEDGGGDVIGHLWQREGIGASGS